MDDNLTRSIETSGGIVSLVFPEEIFRFLQDLLVLSSILVQFIRKNYIEIQLL